MWHLTHRRDFGFSSPSCRPWWENRLHGVQSRAYVKEDEEAQGPPASLKSEPWQAAEHGSRLTSSAVRAVQLVVGGTPSSWSFIGVFPISTSWGERAVCTNAELHWRGDEIGAFTLAIDGVAAGTDLDGVVLTTFEPSEEEEPSDIEIDHVVVVTDSLERTCDAVTQVTGHPLKRVRETADVRQGFHRLGPGGVIVEVVERAGVTATSLWGFVLTVPDLDAVVSDVDRVGAPKNAVQPGRRIATVRSGAGLGVPVALMSR